MHTYFSRHEEGSEEKPLHIEWCRSEKPVKRKEQISRAVSFAVCTGS